MGQGKQEKHSTFDYKPNRGIDGRPNQYDFHQARHDSVLRLVKTGKGAGKTYCGVAEGLFWAINYPGTIGICAEPTIPMIRHNLYPVFKKILDTTLQNPTNAVINSFNETKNELTFSNGSEIWFVSTEHPERNEGPSVDWIHWDECRLTRDFLTTLQTFTSRLRGTGNLPDGVNPSLWMTSTPAPIQSDMWRYLAPESDENVGDCSLFTWHTFDNVGLPESFYVMMDKTNQTDAKRESFLFGDWATSGLGSFKFSYEKHVITDRDLIPWGSPPVYGVDWGYTHPFAISVILFDSDDRAYVVDEFVEREFDADKRWEVAKQLQDFYGVGPFWCGHDRPEFIRGFRERGLDARMNNNRKTKDWKEDLAGRFHIAGDGLPRVFYWHECKQHILEASIYDMDATGKDKVDDDATDASMYGIGNGGRGLAMEGLILDAGRRRPKTIISNRIDRMSRLRGKR